jgi:hypothetical protein
VDVVKRGRKGPLRCLGRCARIWLRVGEVAHRLGCNASLQGPNGSVSWENAAHLSILESVRSIRSDQRFVLFNKIPQAAVPA